MAIKLSTKAEPKKKDIVFETKETVAKLGIDSKGASLELRYGSWNGGEDAYDLRRWVTDEDGKEHGKGIKLSGEELQALYDALVEYVKEA